MNWEIIRYITSGLSLAALLVLAILSGYRRTLKSRETILKTKGADSSLVQGVFKFFPIDTKVLTPEQALNLAREQLAQKEQTTRLVIKLVFAAVVVFGVIALISLFVPKQPKTAEAVTGSLANFAKGLNNDATSRLTLTLNGDAGRLWVGTVRAYDTREILEKICSEEHCLSCLPTPTDSATHVTISLVGRTQQFTDAKGATWLRCAGS